MEFSFLLYPLSLNLYPLSLPLFLVLFYAH